MTTPVREQTVSVPAQAGAVEAEAVPAAPPIDHVRSHSKTCYWDLTQCRWVCAKD
jgi:hypothetical protein